MRILGIDHSTSNTGWGLIEAVAKDKEIKYTYLMHGFIEKPANLTYPGTILNVVENLRAILAEYKPDVVALEAPKDNRGFRATQIMTELLGAIKYCLMRAGYSFSEISPTTMKKLITDYGWSTKEEVAVKVAEILNIPFEDIVPVVLYKSGAKKGQVKELILDGSDSLALALSLIPYTKGLGGQLDYKVGGKA